jgi:hypothetical protein
MAIFLPFLVGPVLFGPVVPDLDLGAALASNGRVIGKLHPQPRFLGAAECLGEADCHLRTDTGLAIDDIVLALARGRLEPCGEEPRTERQRLSLSAVFSCCFSQIPLTDRMPKLPRPRRVAVPAPLLFLYGTRPSDSPHPSTPETTFPGPSRPDIVSRPGYLRCRA